MNLRFLRTFVSIADGSSIGAAAARLHLSQPAASRQILSLEDELGVKLFDRSSRVVRLTSAGEDLLSRARRLLAEADAIRDRAAALRAGDRGIVKIGCPPQVIEAFVGRFIGEYRRRHPNITVQLYDNPSGALPDALIRGDVHFAQIPAGDERLLWRLLYPTYALAVFPAEHKLRSKAKLDIREVADWPLLLLKQDSQARRWIDAALDVVHRKPDVAFESTIPHTLLAMASAGAGVAVIPSNTPILDRNLRAVPIVLRGEAIGRWSSIAWHPLRFMPPYASRFLHAFTDYAKQANPGRRFSSIRARLPRPEEPTL